MTKIMLDGGHGGKDGGAQGNGLSEKVLTLKICQKIKEKLEEYENITVAMTRNTDLYLDLSKRADMANRWNADAFISVHINSATTTSARGFESFIYNNSPSAKTQAFQNGVHSSIVQQIKNDMSDRGKKRANFAVLRETNMIALLTENGFIVNGSDASKLKNDSFLEKLAQGHVNGIVSFFGLKKKEALKTSSGANVAKPTEKLYKVQCGAFKDIEYAEVLVKRLQQSGYSAFITEE
jgi:N-acetylmuramoyl-L-alanine amidase